jgi:hypothetical protein
MRRNPGVRGLSYVEANPGGRISRTTVDEGVLDARRRIERDYPNVRCYSDLENKEHLVTQRDGTGTETLVFAIPFERGFHEGVVRARLERGRNDKSDPLDEIEKHNAAVEKEQERQFADKMGDVGEKLAFAFAQDGLTVRPRMVPVGVNLKKKKQIQNFEMPNR